MRLETIASVDGRPANVVFRPSDRDKKWLQLYDKHKGKIDADFGKLAFTTPPLAAYHSRRCQVHHDRHGQGAEDLGAVRPAAGPDLAADASRSGRSFPEIRAAGQQSVDRPARRTRRRTTSRPAPPSSICTTRTTGTPSEAAEEGAENAGNRRPAWHGTLLPKTDADVWLATAFADYERIVALENAFRKRVQRRS